MNLAGDTGALVEEIGPAVLRLKLFALCERKETKEDTPEKRQAREKLFSEKFQVKAKQLLRELRKQAMIERK